MKSVKKFTHIYEKDTCKRDMYIWKKDLHIWKRDLQQRQVPGVDTILE